MLEIDMREVEDVVVLDLIGRLDLGPQIKLLAQYVQRAAQRPEPRVVLNLQGLTFMDSMGLGELVASFTTVKKLGGSLVLAAPGELVANILKVVRLPNVIKVYDGVDQALADLGQ